MTDENSDSIKMEAYKEYFDLWTKTRGERTEYNKYFITLLFANTLFAIFAAILGASALRAYPKLTWKLLLAALLIAIGISFVWACKLWTLDVATNAQKHVLARMETSLFGSAMVTALTGQELSLAHKNSRSRFIWSANYWGLPVIFVIIFIVIFIAAIVNPPIFSL
jgi:hypothetical protein